MSARLRASRLACLLGLAALAWALAPAECAEERGAAADADATAVQAYVRFQEVARTLAPADAARSFSFRGRILRAGEHAGTWSMQARPAGTAGDWWIEEIIRLDGVLDVRREAMHAASLYPRRGTSRVQHSAGARRVDWRGEDDQLVLVHTPPAGATPEERRAFGGVALWGLAPYVLVAPALRACHEGHVFRATHVYDGVDDAAQVAARDLAVVTDAGWNGAAATLLVFERPGPATIAFDATSGVLLGFRVQLEGRTLDVVPWEPGVEGAAAWDLLTEPAITPAVVALRFLHALERGYLPLAESLVAWPPADRPSADRGAAEASQRRRRAWIEARRIELLADLPPDHAAARLQALLPDVVVREEGNAARVQLPAPYAGWSLLCERHDDGTWKVRAAVE